jgi:predicted lipoprotein with Yx(FWY)xxD motif
MAMFPRRLRPSVLRSLLGVGAVGTGLVLSACGGGASAGTGSANPGTAFGVRQVQGRGSVVVDARGRTVYVLTADGRTNAPCTDASGCTKIWPDLPLPSGVTAARAGAGLQPSLLGTTKDSDGQRYPTYHGWRMYEFSSDSGPGQANGEGIQSFGGTWYVLSASGEPVK